MPQQAEQAAAAQPRATDRMPQLTSLAPTQQIEQTAAVPLCATGHMPQQTGCAVSEQGALPTAATAVRQALAEL